MKTHTGLDVLIASGFTALRGKSIGLLCNQASISADLNHVLDVLLPEHRAGRLKIVGVFGPQHGLHGHTQDNMVEWESRRDGRTGLPVWSLYGENRSPTPEMLEGIDTFVVDLPDVGARYYTFIWTLALSMQACERAGISTIVLDRPNPIGGVQVEGPVVTSEYSSFVGMHPLPTRHGMTIGEIARYFQDSFVPDLKLEVIPMRGWSRGDYFEGTGLPWAMPSPNMPTVDTAVVYPGMCLLEGTTLSEGRGTTRPFEFFGAPSIDGWKLADSLNAARLPGIAFRPIEFEPTFQKHANQLCQGCALHVVDRSIFEPVLTAVAILREVKSQYPESFSWRPPPYEYETEKLPIDILSGNDWLRPAIEGQTPIREIRARFRDEARLFEPARGQSRLYAD